MANNYSLFSTVLGDITKEEEAYLRKDLQDYTPPDSEDFDIQAMWLEEWANEHGLEQDDADPNCWPNFCWTWEKTKDDISELLLYSEEGFDENHLISFIQRFLKKFRPDFTFMVEGANTCSKHRPDEFGGWWLVITANEVVGGNTSDAMREAAAEMEGKPLPNCMVHHLDHADQLEVATYRKNRDLKEPISSITVECTRCGSVVHELYNSDVHGTVETAACPHGAELGNCSACDVAGDLAYDAAREDSRRNF